jgi:hypothetical protein
MSGAALMPIEDEGLEIRAELDRPIVGEIRFAPGRIANQLLPG